MGAVADLPTPLLRTSCTPVLFILFRVQKPQGEGCSEVIQSITVLSPSFPSLLPSFPPSLPFSLPFFGMSLELVFIWASVDPSSYG